MNGKKNTVRSNTWQHWLCAVYEVADIQLISIVQIHAMINLMKSDSDCMVFGDRNVGKHNLLCIVILTINFAYRKSKPTSCYWIIHSLAISILVPNIFEKPCGKNRGKNLPAAKLQRFPIKIVFSFRLSLSGWLYCVGCRLHHGHYEPFRMWVGVLEFSGEKKIPLRTHLHTKL